MKPSTAYARQVFLNCPFDDGYRPIYDALIFTVIACGFVIRCSREREDGGEVRFAKIIEIIRGSQFSIHDISRVEVDKDTGLPRFNMPMELGLFLGAKHCASDSRQKKKRCLILDTEKFRYQKFISDIAGQDIRAHQGKPEDALAETRHWLASVRKRTLPGPAELTRVYKRFCADLPALLCSLRLTAEEMQFCDYVNVATEWLDNPLNRG
jgi:hypothetical protein